MVLIWIFTIFCYERSGQEVSVSEESQIFLSEIQSALKGTNKTLHMVLFVTLFLLRIVNKMQPVLLISTRNLGSNNIFFSILSFFSGLPHNLKCGLVLSRQTLLSFFSLQNHVTKISLMWSRLSISKRALLSIYCL